MEINKSMS